MDVIADRIMNNIVDYTYSWRISNKDSAGVIQGEAPNLAKYLADNVDDLFPQTYYTEEDLEAEINYAKGEWVDSLDSIGYCVDRVGELIRSITLDAEDEVKILAAVEELHTQIDYARF